MAVAPLSATELDTAPVVGGAFAELCSLVLRLGFRVSWVVLKLAEVDGAEASMQVPVIFAPIAANTKFGISVGWCCQQQ